MPVFKSTLGIQNLCEYTADIPSFIFWANTGRLPDLWTLWDCWCWGILTEVLICWDFELYQWQFGIYWVEVFRCWEQGARGRVSGAGEWDCPVIKTAGSSHSKRATADNMVATSGEAYLRKGKILNRHCGRGVRKYHWNSPADIKWGARRRCYRCRSRDSPAVVVKTMDTQLTSCSSLRSPLEYTTTVGPIEDPVPQQVDICWRKIHALETPHWNRLLAGAASQGEKPMQEEFSWWSTASERPMLVQYAAEGLQPMGRTHIGKVLEDCNQEEGPIFEQFMKE